ncbi:MAG: SLBB domain-containing protein [Candidatus Riflebacteria bacterium]|nr:SLBB domain-containing protein [Candidatus Riflebacteria bacterium]
MLKNSNIFIKSIQSVTISSISKPTFGIDKSRLLKWMLPLFILTFLICISVPGFSQVQGYNGPSGSSQSAGSDYSSAVHSSYGSNFSAKNVESAKPQEAEYSKDKTTEEGNAGLVSDETPTSSSSQSRARKFSSDSNEIETAEFDFGEKTLSQSTTGKPSKVTTETEEKESLGTLISNEENKKIVTPTKPFGYEVFKQMNKNPTGNIQGPMGPDYTVGPGDAFQIFIWGREEASFTTEVNVEGDIILPKIGKIPVMGLTFAEMKLALNEAVKRQVSEFEMSVVPIKQRKIRVFVLGDVNNPGVYELGGFATAYAALFTAGGPTNRGGMRSIELKRGEKKLAEIDLYDFLMYGNRSTDVPLQEGDVVFVPLVGPRISVTGAVKRPALYELKTNETKLSTIIKMAGGIIPSGNVQKIQISRIMAHSRQIVFSSELPASEISNPKLMNVTLQDQDKVTIFSVSPRNRELVKLIGHVFEPGIRPWKPGMKLSNIIDKPDLFKKDPYLDYGEIRREIGIGGTTNVISFNPGKVLEKNPKYDLELFPRDEIIIFPAAALHERATVSISGEIMESGSYPLMAGMKIKDLIHAAGGLKCGASQTPAELTRINIKDGKKEIERKEIEIDKALQEEPQSNITLQPFDSLIIRAVPDWKRDNFITLSGEFKYPGKYTFEPGEKLSSIIKRAGFFTGRAFPKGAILKRKSVQDSQKDNLHRILQTTKIGKSIQSSKLSHTYNTDSVGLASATDFAQQKALESLDQYVPSGRVVIHLTNDGKFESSKYDITLETGDELFIPEKPTTVSIEGAVNNPTCILWEEGKTLDFYIKQAGGAANYADINEAILIKMNGTTLHRQRRPVKCFLSSKAEPGDTIWVPIDTRPYSEPLVKKLVPVAQVFGNLAVTAIAMENAIKLK